MHQNISIFDLTAFSKQLRVLRRLLYYVQGLSLLALPSRRTISVLYASLLYILLPLLKSHSGIPTGRRSDRNCPE